MNSACNRLRLTLRGDNITIIPPHEVEHVHGTVKGKVTLEQVIQKIDRKDKI